MALSHEQVGPKISAKIKIYTLTRAELLITLCNEIPCKTNLLMLEISQKYVAFSEYMNFTYWSTYFFQMKFMIWVEKHDNLNSILKNYFALFSRETAGSKNPFEFFWPLRRKHLFQKPSQICTGLGLNNYSMR